MNWRSRNNCNRRVSMLHSSESLCKCKGSDNHLSCRQISELHHDVAEQKSQVVVSANRVSNFIQFTVQSLTTRVQSSREHELSQQLEEVVAQLTEARTHADATVTGAHGELARTRADADRRQRSLQWDVEQMHAKLADAERRNQELADGVANGESADTRVVEK